MGLTTTKSKILNSAIELFNEQGCSHVRLQHIADRSNISIGNLAYHFRNKEAIVELAYEIVGEELRNVLAQFRMKPDLSDLDEQLTSFHCFIHRYPFYFIDILEIKRSYPHLHKQRQQFIQKMIAQIRNRFSFNVERGVLQSEQLKGQYDAMANSIWMIITFWISQNMIKDGSHCNVGAFKSAVWSQIVPFFTSRGKDEFKKLMLNKIS